MNQVTKKLEELLHRLQTMTDQELLAFWDACEVSGETAAMYASLERSLLK